MILEARMDVECIFTKCPVLKYIMLYSYFLQNLVSWYDPYNMLQVHCYFSGRLGAWQLKTVVFYVASEGVPLLLSPR